MLIKSEYFFLFIWQWENSVCFNENCVFLKCSWGISLMEGVHKDVQNYISEYFFYSEQIKKNAV